MCAYVCVRVCDLKKLMEILSLELLIRHLHVLCSIGVRAYLFMCLCLCVRSCVSILVNGVYLTRNSVRIKTIYYGWVFSLSLPLSLHIAHAHLIT